jgi:hypothetical protein
MRIHKSPRKSEYPKSTAQALLQSEEMAAEIDEENWVVFSLMKWRS